MTRPPFRRDRRKHPAGIHDAGTLTGERRVMKNVVPFRTTEFTRLGIDWTKPARSDPERELREAYLTYESSCGTDGLMSVLLLTFVARRMGGIAPDLQHVAEFAEIILAAKLRPHQDDALSVVRSHIAEGRKFWS
jgi:hypothetical protein